MALLSFSCLDYSRVTYILTSELKYLKQQMMFSVIYSGKALLILRSPTSKIMKKNFANLMVFQLPDKAQYNIKAGFNSKSYQWSAIKAFISTIQAEQNRDGHLIPPWFLYCQSGSFFTNNSSIITYKLLYMFLLFCPCHQ